MTKQEIHREVKGLNIALDLASNVLMEEDIKDIARIIWRATERGDKNYLLRR